MRRIASFVGLLCVTAILAPTAAQTPPAADWIAVTSVRARPAAVADFEEYVRKLNAAAGKIGLKVRVDAYQVVQGGSPFQYDFVSGYQSLTDLDSVPSIPAMTIKAYGEAEGNKILRAGRAAIDSVETLVLRYRDEISTKPRGGPGAPFYQLVQVEIDPDKLPEYEANLRKTKEAGDKHASAPTAFRHSVAMGPQFTYVTALPFTTWGERAKWPPPPAILQAAYGQADAQSIGAANRSAIVRQSIWVVAYRRDLSRLPAD